MSGRLTFAIPKGRILMETVGLLEDVGIDCVDALGDSRRLVFESQTHRFLNVRSQDVITYVEHGAADMGVVGKDVLLEQRPEVYEPLDLGIGYCRLVVAQPAIEGDDDDRNDWSAIRVATKYPILTESHFRSKGCPVEIIKLYGSIELAPIVGLSDFIVDLVSTGETMRQNGLVEVETILESTCRLIVNRASMKTRTKEISDLIKALKKRVSEGK